MIFTVFDINIIICDDTLYIQTYIIIRDIYNNSQSESNMIHNILYIIICDIYNNSYSESIVIHNILYIKTMLIKRESQCGSEK